MVRVTHWAETAIFWHVYPLGFVGAPPRAEDQVASTPRLRRLSGWLDHLVALGANGLLLGPVFASETHGYDTVDHFTVDPRLGGEDDLLALVDAAHGRGVRVVLDGVFNHVGRGFPQLADALAHADSPYAAWFRRRPDGSLDSFEGHEHLVALSPDEPAVVDYVVEVMCHWLDRGADGWRLDAAYALPSEFWRQVTDRVHARHPDAWLVGEVIHGDYASFVAEGGLDSVTQYELWKATWSALNDGNLYELAWALDRHQQLLETFVPHTFLGNHDVTRIASRLDDVRHLPHALALLMTAGGVPGIYAGDELGLRGVKEEREGGDDAVRPEFPERPDELGPALLPADAPETLRLHRELVALRRRHPWLVRAHTTVEHLANTAALLRSTADDQALLVALNLAGAPVTMPLPAREAGTPRRWAVAAGAAEVADATVTVAALGWCVLRPG
jgi:cyclomaltodextrinase